LRPSIFKTLFFSADGGSDFGRVQMAEILHFPQDNGFLFNHVWGKTLRDGASNVFGIHCHSNPQLCPVKAIETYATIASELHISVINGYLFPPLIIRAISSTRHLQVLLQKSA